MGSKLSVFSTLAEFRQENLKLMIVSKVEFWLPFYLFLVLSYAYLYFKLVMYIRYQYMKIDS